MFENLDNLKAQIDNLQKLVKLKQNDIDNLREAFVANIQFYDRLVDKQKRLLSSLKNLTERNYLKYNTLLNQTKLNINGTSYIEQESLKNLIIDDINQLKNGANKMFRPIRYGGSDAKNSANNNINNKNSHNNNKNSNSSSSKNKLKQEDGGGGEEWPPSSSNLDDFDIRLPDALEYLPHLSNNQIDSIQPRFKQSNDRFARISIGVPTIKREKTSYLLETLKSLFDAMNDLEKNDALIVVMIAEVKLY